MPRNLEARTLRMKLIAITVIAITVVVVVIVGSWIFLSSLKSPIKVSHPATKYAKMYPFNYVSHRGSFRVCKGPLWYDGDPYPLDVYGVDLNLTGVVVASVGEEPALVTFCEVPNMEMKRVEANLRNRYRWEGTYKGAEIWSTPAPGSPFVVAILDDKIITGRGDEPFYIVNTIKSEEVTTIYDRMGFLISKLKYKDGARVSWEDVPTATSFRGYNGGKKMDVQIVKAYPDSETAEHMMDEMKEEIAHSYTYKSCTIKREGRILEALIFGMSRMAPNGEIEITPSITVSTVDTTVDGGANGADKNISCMVAGVSRADVKWDNITYTVLVNESLATEATVDYVSDDKYVSGGDTVKVTYDSAKLGNTTRVRLTMVYVPTASTAGVWSVTCT